MQVNPLRVKKLHVLAALEVDKFKKKTLDLNPAVTQTTATGRTMQTTATMQNTAAQTLNSEFSELQHSKSALLIGTDEAGSQAAPVKRFKGSLQL